MASSMEWVMKMTVCFDSAMMRLQLALHDLAGHGVERRERLIHEQHLGLGHERPGQTDALAHATAAAGAGMTSRSP